MGVWDSTIAQQKSHWGVWGKGGGWFAECGRSSPVVAVSWEVCSGGGRGKRVGR